MNVNADEPFIRPVAAPTPLARLLPAALQRIRRTSGASLAFAGMIDARSGVTLNTFHGRTVGALAGITVGAGHGLGGKVASDRRPIAVSDYLATASITHQYDGIIAKEGLRAMVAAPVILFDAPVAVLYGAYHSSQAIGDRIKDALAGEVRSLEQRILLAESFRVARGEVLEPAPFTDAGYRDLQARTRAAYGELRAVAAHVGSPDVQQRLLRVAQSLAGGDGAVPAGEPTLTDRERDLLALVATGASNAQIAATLGLAVSTVKSYLKAVMQKLNASTRLEAVVAARRIRQIP